MRYIQHPFPVYIYNTTRTHTDIHIQPDIVHFAQTCLSDQVVTPTYKEVISENTVIRNTWLQLNFDIIQGPGILGVRDNTLALPICKAMSECTPHARCKWV